MLALVDSPLSMIILSRSVGKMIPSMMCSEGTNEYTVYRGEGAWLTVWYRSLGMRRTEGKRKDITRVHVEAGAYHISDVHPSASIVQTHLFK